MEIYRNTVRFDIRLYLKSKKHIPKHRRLMLIEHLIDSIDADGLFPEDLEGHDNFFEPTNEYEKKLWESCREMAKKDINDLKKSIQGGKKSAEIRKQKKPQATPEPKKETIVRGSFIPPTLEEVLDYGRQMNEMIGVGGFMCSRITATDFYNHYESQGWLIGNGIHMTNWQSKLRKWANDEEKRVMES